MKRQDISTRAVLMACHRFYNGDNLAPWQILMLEFDAPEKVVYAAMEREAEKGRIDYGVSIRTSWVTPKGYDFLKFKLGQWDDIRPFDELCEKSKFTYFWTYKGEDRLAPGDNGHPHIVLEEDDDFIKGLSVECCGGIVPDGEFSAGKGYISEVSKSFDLYLEKDAKKAIREYLILTGCDEFIL